MDQPPPTDRRPKAEALSPRDAAALLSVSERTILRLIEAQRLPAIRVGRQWRILISVLRRGAAL